MEENSKPVKKGFLKIKYNSPVILTFALICSIVMVLDNFLLPGLIENFFAVPGAGSGYKIFSPYFFRLFTHAIGHADWSHLIGNFSFILLIGPILEEKYGSVLILEMMFITAIITGILNTLLLPSGLYGASGIVFMLILLISFTNFKAGEIPITFILVFIMYVGKEVFNAFGENNISEFAHIIGGFFGALFGFFFVFMGKKKLKEPEAPPLDTGEL